MSWSHALGGVGDGREASLNAAVGVLLHFDRVLRIGTLDETRANGLHLALVRFRVCHVAAAHFSLVTVEIGLNAGEVGATKSGPSGLIDLAAREQGVRDAALGHVLLARSYGRALFGTAALGSAPENGFSVWPI
ncbi:MAG: hypothetical protein IM674_02790 [Brevundimonas sp.]|nr:hypothetical protein [Brevundimonas sp.]